MRNENDKREKSKIETEDGWNRTFYGSPTIGGLIVVGVIVLYFIFRRNSSTKRAVIYSMVLTVFNVNNDTKTA